MPKVFISYSQDSDAHKARVLALAQALRRDGCEVGLDQFHAHQIVDWPRWCLQQLRSADYVLCVCTAEYRDRIYGNVPAGSGNGAHWEGAWLDDEFYRLKGNDRVLPLLLDGQPADSIPDFMRGWTYCRLAAFELADAAYERLLRILSQQPEVIAEPVGTMPVLPPRSTAAAASGTAGSSGSGTGMAVPPPPVSAGLVIGASLTELLQVIEAEKNKETARLQPQIDALAGRLDVTESALRGFLRILGEHDIAADKLAERFAEIVQRHKDSLQRLAALDADDPASRAAIEHARQSIEAGDYEAADHWLAEVENADVAAARHAQQLAADAQAAARRHWLSAAAARAERGDVALTRIDYRAAAEHFRQAAQRVPEDELDIRAGYLHKQADALHRQGEEFGDNAALLGAIDAWRALLGLRTQARVPLDWARTQNNLGSALARLGERESGPQRLEDAVAAFRAALGQYTRERVPLDWAMTQNNLGNALQTLGKRESGPQRLEEAVAAYRAALGEYTREHVPLAWATAQNNLGTALAALGERESDPQRLEAAVAAYRASLGERTRERVPLVWAATQNNLGGALARLGLRESGPQRLEEAVAAFRAALEERTRERVPLDWAATQTNLGNALLALGERESGPQRLEEAVVAYRAALGEYTRERVPLAWATIQHNLGAALRVLGSRESGPQRLEEAVAAYRAALEERTRERVPLAWAMTQNNLGLALAALGERESGPQRLEDAVAAYHAALDVFRAAQAGYYIEVVEGNLREAETLLAARRP